MRKVKKSDLILFRRASKKFLRNARHKREYDPTKNESHNLEHLAKSEWWVASKLRRVFKDNKRYTISFPPRLDIFSDDLSWTKLFHNLAFPKSSSVYSVGVSACGDLDYWDSRAACGENFTKEADHDKEKVLQSACSSISRDSDSSNCFIRGFSSLSSREDAPAMLVKACGDLDYWDSRADCYKAGTNRAKRLRFRFARYLSGCLAQTRDSSSAQCFTDALRSL